MYKLIVCSTICMCISKQYVLLPAYKLLYISYRHIHINVLSIIAIVNEMKNPKK